MYDVEIAIADFLTNLSAGFEVQLVPAGQRRGRNRRRVVWVGATDGAHDVQCDPLACGQIRSGEFKMLRKVTENPENSHTLTPSFAKSTYDRSTAPHPSQFRIARKLIGRRITPPSWRLRPPTEWEAKVVPVVPASSCEPQHHSTLRIVARNHDRGQPFFSGSSEELVGEKELIAKQA